MFHWSLFDFVVFEHALTSTLELRRMATKTLWKLVIYEISHKELCLSLMVLVLFSGSIS